MVPFESWPPGKWYQVTLVYGILQNVVKIKTSRIFGLVDSQELKNVVRYAKGKFYDLFMRGCHDIGMMPWWISTYGEIKYGVSSFRWILKVLVDGYEI